MTEDDWSRARELIDEPIDIQTTEQELLGKFVVALEETRKRIDRAILECQIETNEPRAHLEGHIWWIEKILCVAEEGCDNQLALSGL